MWKFLNLLFCLCWGEFLLWQFLRNRELFAGNGDGTVWFSILTAPAMVLMAILLLFSDQLFPRFRNSRKLLRWSWYGLTCLFLASLGLLAPLLLAAGGTR